MKKLIFILTAGLLLSGLSYAKQQQWGNNVSFEMVISRDSQRHRNENETCRPRRLARARLHKIPGPYHSTK